MNYPRIRYQYLSDKNNFIHSCIAVRVDREANEIRYQVATMNSRDKSNFKKSQARFIACQRLEKVPFVIKANLSLSGAHEITRLVMDDMYEKKEHYVAEATVVANGELTWDKEKLVRALPQRVRNEAKKWLRSHVEERPTMPSLHAATQYEETSGSLPNLANQIIYGTPGDTLPPTFSEDFASDDAWDSIPQVPVSNGLSALVQAEQDQDETIPAMVG